METIIRHCGRYTLVQTEKGFVWCMTGGTGGRWYWDPKTLQWIARRECYPTEARASMGFDPLTPERAAAALMNSWEDHARGEVGVFEPNRQPRC